MTQPLREDGTHSASPRRGPHEAEQAQAREETRVRFVDAGAREDLVRALEAGAAMVVAVAIEASARGRLGDVIEEAIERELDARGAAPPGIGAASDRDAALSDQLFRARRVGASGIAIAVGPLRAATSSAMAIEPEDGATLRFWAGATADRPVCLLLDASDERTGAYAEPIALRTVIARAMHESEAAAAEDEETSIDTTPTEAIQVGAGVIEATRVRAGDHEERAEEEEEAEAATASASASATATATANATVAVDWHPLVHALVAARGAQPLAAFERLFAQAYMPLVTAIADGLDDPRALHAADEFRRTFSRAYSEACPTFALTGKRPRMVLDAFDVAAKIGRLHGARTTQLLLVDAMRFDLCGRVLEGVRARMAARASLTDEVVMWSALPTTTIRQLETLSRGVDALRANDPPSEREGETIRGRTSDVIRRVKLGSRDVYKLDAIEARLRDDPRAFDVMAGAAADAIARHAASLKPRTLLFVFGDHGFAIDRQGRATHGGASPEEVLVGGFALLVGDTH